MPLARGLQVSAMCQHPRLRAGGTRTLGVCRLWLPSLAHLADCPSQYQTPLTLWFWAAYLMTTDKRGISALLLQRQLGLRRYETAWMMLHKLRRAMVNVAREPLRGEVEIDDTWVGGLQAGRRRQPMAAFQTLLGLGTVHGSTHYDSIRSARDLSRLPGRP